MIIQTPEEKKIERLEIQLKKARHTMKTQDSRLANVMQAIGVPPPNVLAEIYVKETDDKDYTIEDLILWYLKNYRESFVKVKDNLQQEGYSVTQSNNGIFILLKEPK